MLIEGKRVIQVNYTEVDQNLNQNNAAWVVSKTKVHFNKYPTWKDIIYARSYTRMHFMNHF